MMRDWLKRRALSSPDHPAIICDDRTASFADLARSAALASERLQQLGVQRGDRVAALAHNGIEFIELMHGVTHLGAVLVPLNRRLSRTEFEEQLQDCSAALFCYDRTTRDTVANVATPTLRVCLDSGGLPGDPAWGGLTLSRAGTERALLGGDPPAERSDPGDSQVLHTIIYTSGSTRRPKGVLLTSSNHFWSAIGSAFNLGVHVDDRWLACLPFSHVGGLSILLRGVIYGTSVVVHDRFDPERVNHAIDTERVTIVSVVANMLQRIFEARGDRPYPKSLRCVLLGGGPAPRPLLDECVARGFPVVQTYGLTEAASQVTTLAPRDAVRKLGSAGKPLITTELRIVDGNDAVRPGASGEIQIRGLTISPGYTRGDVGPPRPDGWFPTGDLGRLDEEGFLYVVGRRDDVIISGGEKIHPAEVERVLETHPAVVEACVFGEPDDDWGQVVAAAVRLREGSALDANDLQAHVRRALAKFKAPRRVHIVSDFPRTASGKIIRRQVRQEMASAERM